MILHNREYRIKWWSRRSKFKLCLCMPVTLTLKVTQGKIILSHQNETNLLIFSHGDNRKSRIFFAGQFPMLFCLFHAVLIMIAWNPPETLKELKHCKKIPSSELWDIRKTKLGIFLIMGVSISKLSLFNKLRKIYRKHILNFKKIFLRKFRVPGYHFWPLPKNDNFKFF